MSAPPVREAEPGAGTSDSVEALIELHGSADACVSALLERLLGGAKLSEEVRVAWVLACDGARAHA